ncbi:MAG: hypothetical protein E7671_03000 [Ruminococcaceae bacterium]|nr:hypothetical protein [Oscillospiraceae bacterium]
MGKLAQASFAVRNEYSLDKNRYALCDGEKATVYVAYSAKANTVRLYIEEKDSTAYHERNTGAAEKGVPDF